jgi:hypothetical protein
MKLWNDELRICPKCKSPIDLASEEKAACPKCGQVVWFYNFRPQASPPPVPPEHSARFFDDPVTWTLLAIAGGAVLVVALGIYSLIVVVAMSGLAIACSIAYALLRHADARRLETDNENFKRWQAHAEQITSRVREVAHRYNTLLQTGDARVEHYYRTIYEAAEEERRQAEQILASARAEREAIRTVDERIRGIAERFVTDHMKWSTQKLRPDPENYQRRKEDLQKALEFAERVGYRVPPEIRSGALTKLKQDYANVVREATLKDEQRRIQQQMRDELRLRRDAERALQEAERSERELEDRLEAALRSHKDVMDAEVQELRAQLAETHSQAERAKSMAQLTRAGHVYILSNVGSFGENLFKVGMTRRLDPHDRVHELGDASVPFPFDVHAMISCDDAPKLENSLHRELTRYRVNRVNLRKEFFQIELGVILESVRRHHGHVDYIAEPEALQYRESMQISPESLVELESELEALGVTLDEEE